MSFAIYTRLSREDDDKPTDVGSCATQRTRGIDFAKRQRWAGDALTLDDDGASGAVVDRPGLTALLDAARAGRIQRVIVRDLDRLARDQVYAAWVLAELDRAGVEAWSYVDGKRISLRGYEGVITSLKSFAAEAERQKTIERTRDALRRRAELGLATGAAPLGYRNVVREDKTHDYEIDPDEAAIVVDLAERYVRAEGNQSQVCREVNAKGVRTPRGGHWTVERLVRTLRNPLYRGTREHGKRGAVIENGRKRWIKHPRETWVRVERPELRILPAKLAAQVDRLLATPRPRRWGGAAEAKHIASLFVSCSHCGSSMCATAGRYRCRKRHQAGSDACEGISSRPIEAVDAEVLRLVLPLLDPDRVMADVRAQLARGSDTRERERTRIRKTLAAVEKRVANINEAIAEGGRAPASLLAKLRAEETAAEEHRAALVALDGPSPTRVDAKRTEAAVRARLERLYALAQAGGMAARPAVEAVLRGKRFAATPIEVDGRTRWQLLAEVDGGYLFAPNDPVQARGCRATAPVSDAAISR